MEYTDSLTISNGVEPEEFPPPPHFDEEATLLSARPVEPLTTSAMRAQGNGSRRRPGFLLPLIIIAAVGAGIASGFAIGYYKNRQAAPSAVVAQPPDQAVSAEPSQNVEQQTKPVQPVISVAPAKQPETVAHTKDAATTVEQTTRKDEKPERKQKEKQEDAHTAATPAALREKQKNDRADELRAANLERERKRQERDARRLEEQQHEARRHQRDEDDRTADERPRRAEHAQRQVNRITEIFEGVPRPQSTP